MCGKIQADDLQYSWVFPDQYGGELLEESGEELVDTKTTDSKVDQAELDDKITKSVLVNLFEGALI